MKYINNFLGKKIRLKLTLLILAIPYPAFASDPTSLMVGLVGVVIVFTSLLFFITFLLSKKIKNQNIKRLLRILPFTLFLSPSFAGGVGYIWPSGIVILTGSVSEKLISVLSIVIWTLVIYFFWEIKHKKMSKQNEKESEQK